MQYPRFRRDGWPIGSGMVESANKNVVEARLKGTGMHWERRNVNPMLALRNAICNDRWREMWQKAVLHHQKLQTLQRAARAKQRAQALLAAGDAPSQDQESSPSQSAAPSQPVLEGAAFPIPSLLPASEASKPRSRRLSSRRKQRTARNRVKYAHRRSDGVSGEVCSCGKPFVQSVGGRSKQYCSNGCRQRAYRKQQTPVQQPSPPAPATTLLSPSRAPTRSSHKRAAKCESEQESCSLQRSGRVKGETCLSCGTRLLQSIGGRLKEYCSGRCRLRAHRGRHAQIS